MIDLVNWAKATIENEAKALLQMKDSIDEQFQKAINFLKECKDRVVISGIGKSAVIAQKIVATMNSTGTPALFMHAADAIHGDLGMIQQGDVVIVISKSGETSEIKALVPLIKNFGNCIIAICGNENSFLAREANVFLNTTIDKEACPNNLAPTTSTTVQMVMGDALAICLLQLKGFTASDFAKYHPGGALGKRLYLRVGDLSRQNPHPQVETTANLKEIIFSISSDRLGATAVCHQGKLFGIITDGDLRRMMEKETDFTNIKAMDICSPNPKNINQDALAIEALNLMRANNISQLIVLENEKYAGMVHLHDLLREGLI